ncbi:hypothetical protein HN014_08185 [Aquimarina sp. TRL1]|uniref:hypothetical protein n=1 Tax=Aquimarina sp. (strain TRL1) TaxID=2736252 RepID=UPI00158A8361|nr:hypothetical protein [Aquimarina sp. TRL1]QKX04897.1 hypothetical protein HN014_08185 [Aquimarina sp. TRL1]
MIIDIYSIRIERSKYNWIGILEKGSFDAKTLLQQKKIEQKITADNQFEMMQKMFESGFFARLESNSLMFP